MKRGDPGDRKPANHPTIEIHRVPIFDPHLWVRKRLWNFAGIFSDFLRNYCQKLLLKGTATARKQAGRKAGRPASKPASRQQACQQAIKSAREQASLPESLPASKPGREGGREGGQPARQQASKQASKQASPNPIRNTS